MPFFPLLATKVGPSGPPPGYSLFYEGVVVNPDNFVFFGSADGPLYIGNKGYIADPEAVYRLEAVGGLDGDLDLTLFTGLQQLIANGASFNSVVGLPNTILYELDLANNGLNTIDLTGLATLQIVNVSYNNITSISVGASTDLSNLNVSYNSGLGVVGLSSNPMLQIVNVSGCALSGSEGNLTSNTLITEFYGGYMSTLTAIDATGLEGMTSFTVSEGSNITAITIDECFNLHNFGAFGHALDQSMVDYILQSILNSTLSNGWTGGTIQLEGGTNANPGGTGLAAKATLEGTYGWSVQVNGD